MPLDNPSASPTTPAVSLDRHLLAALQKHHLTVLTAETLLHASSLYGDLLRAVGGETGSPLGVSVLTYLSAVASSSGGSGAVGDSTALLTPVNSSLLKPIVVLFVPTMLRALLHEQDRQLVLGGRGPSTDAADLVEGLLLRVYQQMCSAASRNQSLLVAQFLPLTYALPDDSSIGETVSGQSGAASTPVADGRPPLRNGQTLTLTALRDRAAYSTAYALPALQQLTLSNVHLFLYASLCACAYMLPNLTQQRDVRVCASTEMFGFAVIELLTDPAYVQVARRDAALAAATVSLLHSTKALFFAPGLVSGSGAFDGEYTGGACDGKGNSEMRSRTATRNRNMLLWQQTVELWSAECFSHAEFSTAATSLLPLLT